MQEPKYKTPNGQIVEKKELQSKYGAKFDELVQNKTFLEVNEPVYKTPSGKYEVESVLAKKYGEKFNELKTNNTFVLDTPEKKKESSQSPSVQPKSGSVPKTGSSGTAKQSFRLPTEKEFEEGQKRGEFAPNRSMLKSKETQYDLEGNTGNVVQKPKEVIGKESDYVLETKEINQKPFEKQTAINPRFSEEQKSEVKSEISEAKKLSTPEYEEEIYNFTNKDKEQLKSDIDTQISEEDLDNPVPFKFYSTYDKQPEYNPATRTFTQIPKDMFVDNEFGD